MVAWNAAPLPGGRIASAGSNPVSRPMAKMNKTVKFAKETADKLGHLLADEEAQAWLHETERKHMTKTFDTLTKLVVDNGGPAWNASEEQWEY